MHSSTTNSSIHHIHPPPTTSTTPDRRVVVDPNNILNIHSMGAHAQPRDHDHDVRAKRQRIGDDDPSRASEEGEPLPASGSTTRKNVVEMNGKSCLHEVAWPPGA